MNKNDLQARLNGLIEIAKERAGGEVFDPWDHLDDSEIQEYDRIRLQLKYGGNNE